MESLIQPASNAVKEKEEKNERKKIKRGKECFSTEKEPVVRRDTNTLLSAKSAAN